MVKQIILILGVSVAAILFKDQLSQALDAVVYAHNYVAKSLHFIFSDDQAGSVIQDLIALLVIPLICGLLAAIIFWATKRTEKMQFMPVIWVVWLVLMVTMVAQNGVMNNHMVNNAHGMGVATRAHAAPAQVAATQDNDTIENLQG